MFNNNDYGMDKSISKQLLNTYIKNIGEKLVIDAPSSSINMKSLDSNYNTEIFSISDNVEELVSSLYNIPINIDYEDFGRDLQNKRLIITSMQEINIFKNVDNQLEYFDESLTNILLDYDYVDDKIGLVEGKLDKHVKQVKQSYNALIKFFYTDYYSSPKVNHEIKLSSRISSDKEIQKKYTENIRVIGDHMIEVLGHFYNNIASFQANLQK